MTITKCQILETRYDVKRIAIVEKDADQWLWDWTPSFQFSQYSEKV